MAFARFNPNVHTIEETRQALLRIHRALDESQVAKNNYTATRNPINGVGGDDASDGYSIGSIWINVTLDRIYMLEDATVGAASWILLAPEGGSAPLAATFITQTPSADLLNEQALSALATGILKSTTGTGVVSIAAAGTDYALPSSVHEGEFRITLFADATPVAFF
jgi:hypothetical protein